MFSTYDGAKRQSKYLNKALLECSIIFPLSKCQTALAYAQGYSNWHELKSSIASMPREIEPAIFKRRLLNILPEPCRRPADYWADRRPYEWANADNQLTIEISMEFRNWYEMVNPYFFSLLVGFNRNPPILQPGSGKGQRLRKSLVQSVIQNTVFLHSETGCPKLNPVTLSIQKTGRFSMFVDSEYRQHKDFKREFQRVVDSGCLTSALMGPIRVI